MTRAARRALIALAVLLALAGGAVAVVEVDTHNPALREVVVPVPGLAREVTLVQATDLHSVEFGRGESELASLLRGHHVDAAVMTGDVLDEPDEDKQPAYDLAAVLLAATPRVYYLPGNHDPADLGPALATRGVVPLAPGVVEPLVDAARGGAASGIVYGRDSAAIRGAKGASSLLVIASHTPPNPTRLAAGATLRPPHLFIAGHTHGGQVRLPLLGAIASPTAWEGEEGGHVGTTDIRLFPDLRGYLVDGMYSRDGQRVNVATGLGVTWMRWRFLDRSELVLYRFVPQG